MRLKDNLLIYIIFGVLMYLLMNTTKDMFIILIINITISVVVGKTIEFLSYKISTKYKFNFINSIIFSLLILFIILGIMKYIGLIGNLILIIPATISITIFMVFISYRRSCIYNEKLKETKKRFDKEEKYEDN